MDLLTKFVKIVHIKVGRLAWQRAKKKRLDGWLNIMYFVVSCPKFPAERRTFQDETLNYKIKGYSRCCYFWISVQHGDWG